MSIKINLEGTASMIQNLDRALMEIQKRSMKGLVLCQALLTHEAMEITPWNTGHLAGSFQAPIPREVSPGVIEAVVENTAEYALKVHEMPENTNWNKKGTGPKFLERPLFENADTFREIIRNATAM